MMQKKRTIALILALCFAVLLIDSLQQSAYRVGFVDMEKVVKESPKVKALQDQLDAKERNHGKNAKRAKRRSNGSAAEAAGFSGEYRQLQKQVGEQFESDLKKTLEQIAQEKKLTVILYKREVAPRRH